MNHVIHKQMREKRQLLLPINNLFGGSPFQEMGLKSPPTFKGGLHSVTHFLRARQTGRESNLALAPGALARECTSPPKHRGNSMEPDHTC